MKSIWIDLLENSLRENCLQENSWWEESLEKGEFALGKEFVKVSMQEDLPPRLADAAHPEPEPVDTVSEFVKEHFPDLHIEGWVIDVPRNVHFGTLEKMAVHAATRLELICVASHSDSTASTLNVLLMQFALKFIGQAFLHKNLFFYSLFSHMNITFFRRTFCQQSPHSDCHISV